MNIFERLFGFINQTTQSERIASFSHRDIRLDAEDKLWLIHWMAVCRTNREKSLASLPDDSPGKKECTEDIQAIRGAMMGINATPFDGSNIAYVAHLELQNVMTVLDIRDPELLNDGQRNWIVKQTFEALTVLRIMEQPSIMNTWMDKLRKPMIAMDPNLAEQFS